MRHAEKFVEREPQPVSFGERLASSQAFADLFRDGMALVEETATYLDGPGRQESKKLERAAALAYATESMRLTTRLMQLASWLLLHRAVKEGEMSLAQANKEKTKVKLSRRRHARSEQSSNCCRSALRDLIERSQSLQSKVRRLDATIHTLAADRAPSVNPVEHQLGPAESGVRARRASRPASRSRIGIAMLARIKQKAPREAGAFLSLPSREPYFLPVLP